MRSRPDYDGADVVVVNTCGFLDSAKQESLDAIGEAMAENGRVIVTGCMGVEEGRIRDAHPGVLAVTGPHQYEAVVGAVHDAVPPLHDPFVDLVPPEGLRLTPRHYAYLKISEGCNNRCSFCIIPSSAAISRAGPPSTCMTEAERLVKAGVKELLVISQDTSAYGVDIKYAESQWNGAPLQGARSSICAKALGELGAWVRLHYVYPYPHVDDVIPLMAEGKILPYLDIPFQHASPARAEGHAPPGARRRRRWSASPLARGLPRSRDPLDLHRRLSRRDRGGLRTPARLAPRGRRLSARRLLQVRAGRGRHGQRRCRAPFPTRSRKSAGTASWRRSRRSSAEHAGRPSVGREIDVIIDEVDEEGAIGRSQWDAPEIDGSVFLNGETDLKPGDIVRARVDHADEYDLEADLV